MYIKLGLVLLPDYKAHAPTTLEITTGNQWTQNWPSRGLRQARNAKNNEVHGHHHTKYWRKTRRITLYAKRRRVELGSPDVTQRHRRWERRKLAHNAPPTRITKPIDWQQNKTGTEWTSAQPWEGSKTLEDHTGGRGPPGHEHSNEGGDGLMSDGGWRQQLVGQNCRVLYHGLIGGWGLTITAGTEKERSE